MSIQPLSTNWYKCSKCKSSFLVSTDDKSVRILGKVMQCPNRSKCGGKITLRAFKPTTTHIDDAVWMTAIGLFQATRGLGHGDERKCSPEEITKALVGNQIMSVHLEKAPDPNKSILVSMTLANGKTFFLASSTAGAIVYKVIGVTHGR